MEEYGLQEAVWQQNAENGKAAGTLQHERSMNKSYVKIGNNELNTKQELKNNFNIYW